MFLDEISIQTSIAIYAGLGFVFFLGLGKEEKPKEITTPDNR